MSLNTPSQSDNIVTTLQLSATQILEFWDSHQQKTFQIGEITGCWLDKDMQKHITKFTEHGIKYFFLPCLFPKCFIVAKEKANFTAFFSSSRWQIPEIKIRIKLQIISSDFLIITGKLYIQIVAYRFCVFAKHQGRQFYVNLQASVYYSFMHTNMLRFHPVCHLQN